MEIIYKKGDIFKLLPKDKYICIPHCVNDEYKWGAGFVLGLNKYFPKAKEEYLKWDSIKLGRTQFVYIQPNIVVANMCGQEGVGFKNGVAPVRYAKLFQCIESVAEFCKDDSRFEIFTVKFGAGLAGGSWPVIENMIKESWKDIKVTVYEL